MLLSLGLCFLRLLRFFFLLFFFGSQCFAVVLIINKEGRTPVLSQRRRGDGAWRTWFPRPPIRYRIRTSTPPLLLLHRPYPAHCPSQSQFERWKSVVSVVLEVLLPKSRALPPPTIPIAHHHPTSSNARERRRRRLAESSSFSFAGCGGASNFITGFSSSSIMISASTCLLRVGRFCSCCAVSNRSKRGSYASLSLLVFTFFFSILTETSPECVCSSILRSSSSCFSRTQSGTFLLCMQSTLTIPGRYRRTFPVDLWTFCSF